MDAELECDNGWHCLVPAVVRLLFLIQLIYVPVPPGFALYWAFVSSPAWDRILHHIRE
jgi:hypothetical protein